MLKARLEYFKKLLNRGKERESRLVDLERKKQEVKWIRRRK